MSSQTPSTGASRLAVVERLSPRGKLAAALAAYVVWTALTWLLEGRVRTLLRPEDVTGRLLYTGVANVLAGTILALWLAGAFTRSGFTSRSRLGFRSVGRTVGSVVVAAVLGGALYWLQRPPSMDPVVIANAFAQVLPVSTAEIVVCWIVVGGGVEAFLRARGLGDRAGRTVALVVASALFGAYHLAHSPPFDNPETMAFLSVVSVGTGLFYFAGRSAYGALVFHNVLALFGVTAALAAAGRLGAFRAPVTPLLATALVSLLVLVAAERRLVRDAA